MLGIGVLASGRGTNLQCIIDAVESGLLEGVSVGVVISDRPGARALERAKKHGIEAVVIDRKAFETRAAFDEAIMEELVGRGVGLVVLAGFMRVLGPAFIDAFDGKIINIHPSLLPSFTGLQVHERAIEAGVRFSGCTVHFVDKGLDTGPIIIQAVVPVLPGDSADTLAARILKEEHRILPQAIDLFARGRLRVEGRRVVVSDHEMAGESVALENPVVRLGGGATAKK
jgi:phosphoribosylglycinamide formyltransferase-1